MTPLELRLHLHRNGYCPLPLIGKAPVLKNWQQKTDTNESEIELWSSIYPGATNTGTLTRMMPTLDLDILNEEAARDAEQIVRSHHEEHGLVLVRIGRPPKRAIPFRTDEPFKKIQVGLIAPNGSEEKVEFLCDGQQVAVAGLHPDINQPYRWHGGELWQTAREDLPYIREAEARALVDEIADLLCRDFGYRRAAERPKARQGNGDVDAGGTADWQYLYNNIRDGHALHDCLRDLAAKLIASGMSAGAAVNQLRALMQASTAQHDARWQKRHADIPRLVEGAVKFLKAQASKPRRGNGADIAAEAGAALLDDVRSFLCCFVCYPSEHAATAHTLWAAHTHLMSAWESTPRLSFLSPEPASGKTRALEVTEPLVPRPVHATNVSPAYLYRKCGSDEGPPTILFDEIDAIFGPKAKEHEDVRSFLNSGHRRGATFGRCVVYGKRVETEDVQSFAAVALAGLGWLPDSIMTRSVTIRMRRRAPDEQVEAFRHRIHAPIGRDLCRRLED